MTFPATRDDLTADGWNFECRRRCRSCKRTVEIWRRPNLASPVYACLSVRSFHEEPAQLIDHNFDTACPEAQKKFMGQSASA